MAYCVSQIGISYSDFWELHLGEVQELILQHLKAKDEQVKNEWEQTRLISFSIFQSVSKKRLKIKKVVPLPWDKKSIEDLEPKSVPSMAQMRKRLQQLKVMRELKS